MPSYIIEDSTITFYTYLSILIWLIIFVTTCYIEYKRLDTILHSNKCYFGVSFLRATNLQVQFFCLSLYCYNTKCSNIIMPTHVNGRALQSSLQQALSDVQCLMGLRYSGIIDKQMKWNVCIKLLSCYPWNYQWIHKCVIISVWNTHLSILDTTLQPIYPAHSPMFPPSNSIIPTNPPPLPHYQ